MSWKYSVMTWYSMAILWYIHSLFVFWVFIIQYFVCVCVCDWNDSIVYSSLLSYMCNANSMKKYTMSIQCVYILIFLWPCMIQIILYYSFIVFVPLFSLLPYDPLFDKWQYLFYDMMTDDIITGIWYDDYHWWPLCDIDDDLFKRGFSSIQCVYEQWPKCEASNVIIILICIRETAVWLRSITLCQWLNGSSLEMA